jgi:cystathionine beta-lyase/cystathionine gamma-synthase
MRIIEMAKERGIAVVVDNTFATPQLWHPLEHGADIVVHSATKYLGGHGNLTAGVLCGNDQDIRKGAMLYRQYVGNILSADDASRLGTQLQTFKLRLGQQCDNALNLAQVFAKHPEVGRVRYPGLDSHATYSEAMATFGARGFGAMINVGLKGGREAADAFVEAVADTILYVPTLGDPTTIMLHVATVWGEERFPYPGMLRISVGFEPYERLAARVMQALDEIA